MFGEKGKSLHKLAGDTSRGDDASTYTEVTAVLKKRRTVKVAPASGTLGRSRTLLIDHEAIWKGIVKGQTTFSNVAFAAEDDTAFKDASEELQRLRSLPHGRVQYIDQGPKGAAGYKAVLDVVIPHDPDYYNKADETALYVAAGRKIGGSDAILALVRGYADPDARIAARIWDEATGKYCTKPAGTPLVAAIDAGNAENVRVLLTLGASIDERISAIGSDGKLRERSVLQYAADKASEAAGNFTVGDMASSLNLDTQMHVTDAVCGEIRKMVANPTQTIVEFLDDTRDPTSETLKHFANADLASVENLYGYYPLHSICSADGGCDVDQMKGIISEYPAVVALKTISGDLPLHLALREGSHTADNVKQLMEMPSSWKQGFTRDHMADEFSSAFVSDFNNPLTSQGHDDEEEEGDDGATIENPGKDNEDLDHPFNKKLLKSVAGGKLAEVKDSYGCLPLHLALRNSTDEVCMAVLEKYPEAAALIDGDGDSCLRLALVRNKAVPADSEEASARKQPPEIDEDQYDIAEEVDVERASDRRALAGDLDNDGILSADEIEALRDDTSIVRKGKKALTNPYATLGHAASMGSNVLGGFAAMAGLELSGGEVDTVIDPDVGVQIESRSVEIIRALLTADPGAATRTDCDGRTALQLAMEVSIPADKLEPILEANPAAAALPLVKARLTLSMTVPRGLGENRAVVGKLPNGHTVYQKVPEKNQTGQVIRKGSMLDATVIHVSISMDLKGGEEFTHSLNSGQMMKLKVPRDTDQMATHPKRKNHWLHPFQVGNLEEIDYFVPPGATEGSDDKVYTRVGSRVKVKVPKRRRAGMPVSLLIRPLAPTEGGNPECLLHAAIVSGRQPDVIVMLAHAHPAGMQMKNRYGQLPLHLLCIDGANLTSVNALLEHNEAAASSQNDFGDLPLHILLQNSGQGQCDVDVACRLLELCPDALTMKDSGVDSTLDDGRYPLHAALVKPKMDKFIHLALKQDLEGTNPAAVESPDDDLPLHLALENESGPDVVQALLLAYPEGITTKRSDGTNNLSTVFINADRRKINLTQTRIDELCEISEMFYVKVPTILSDPKLSDPRLNNHKDLPLHIAINQRSVDQMLLTTIEATHKHGIEIGNDTLLQDLLLKPFNGDTQQPFTLMLEQNRGLHIFQRIFELCDTKSLLNQKNPDSSYPVQVVMEHCTRAEVSTFIVNEHVRFKCHHQPTTVERLFLAARTGNVDVIHEFVRTQNVDFNAQNENGLTAKEVAGKHGHTRCVQALPTATSAALSRDALKKQMVEEGGKASVAELKFQAAPFIAMVGGLLHYLDIYTDISLTLKFGNIHFPPFNRVCDELSADDQLEFAGVCSTYEETNFFFFSAAFLVTGVVATCIVDYFMMHTTETVFKILVYWCMNLTLLRMYYECLTAIRNRLKGRMPQAGLAAVKAAEGLFEAVPQLLLQGFILFRLFLEPLRPMNSNPTAGDGGIVDEGGCQSYVSWSELYADETVSMTPPDQCVLEATRGSQLEVLNSPAGLELTANWTSCTASSAYFPATHCGGTLQNCSRVEFDVDHNECLSSSDVWQQLARSITIGLVSTSSSIAILPETVRGQWRVAFAMYILCQVLFRVFAFTMAATVAVLIGKPELFALALVVMYLIQACISSPKRVELAKQMMRDKNTAQAKKDRILEEKQARSKIMTDYSVLVQQPLQAHAARDSAFVQTRDKVTGNWSPKMVNVGDVINTLELEHLPCGAQRVKLKSGWLSVHGHKGVPLLMPRPQQNAANAAVELVATPQEKLWIGLLTIIVPVQFDTIKNIHKSNPDTETGLSFGLRVCFNVLLTLPFWYIILNFDNIETAPGSTLPYTYIHIDAGPETPNIMAEVWKERISISRAKNLLYVRPHHLSLSAGRFDL